ncbi:hypothetical protein CSA56_04845 [candidate division KSB3 bacterium]|uniref:Uncharacterized protein n=1 Tax=candidate division KSB3 bacterium TaxID=2044937 RepID=A0A2G6KHW5_9BACT|nr:MAG: hypothetical protein CSA56_04845 [candidate division KSB3 bacterium]
MSSFAWTFVEENGNFMALVFVVLFFFKKRISLAFFVDNKPRFSLWCTTYLAEVVELVDTLS